MNDVMAALRADAASESRDFRASPEPAHDDADVVDDLMANLISTRPPSDAWLAAIDDLALSGPTVNRPAGSAAVAAQEQRAVRAINIEQALGVPTTDARQGLQEAFGLGRDAADELLERPAAALAQRPAQSVRTLAALVGRPIGELFDDIASSARASSGYVYAYRPGNASNEPAARRADADMRAFIHWGVALLS